MEYGEIKNYKKLLEGENVDKKISVRMFWETRQETP